jgi:hypothetical protein
MFDQRIVRSLFGGLLLSFVCLVGEVGAQWSHNPPENNPICQNDTIQYPPVMVGDGHGGAIIAWEDTRAGNGDIYAQRIDSSGTTRWTTDGIVVSNAAADQGNPKIVSDGSGGAIIVWPDYRNVNGDIYAQRIDSLGVARWTANGVPICTNANNQYAPGMSADGSGGAIIAWQDDRNGLLDIYAQKVNASGVVQWTANGIAISAATSDQYGPVITGDGSGGAVIAWTDTRNGGFNNDIYAQRVNGSGLVQWTVNGIGVCLEAHEQDNPLIVGDGAGGAILAWNDFRNGVDYDIYAQKLSGSGATLGVPDGTVICYATNSQYLTSMIEDGSGGAFLAWYDLRSGVAYNIYAQKVSSAGITEWTTNGSAVSTGTANQYTPVATRDGAGGIIVSWEDTRNGLDGDIYAQRLDAFGSPRWKTLGVQVSTADNDQAYPRISSDGGGGAIVTWEDFRPALVADIYAQKVDSLGYLGINNPVMKKVGDVAGDQGGKVTVSWDRSDLDKYPFTDIQYYSVWRGVDQGAVPAGTTFKSPGEIPADAGAGAYRKIETASGTTYWELMGTQTAHRFPGYSYTAPTLADSSVAGIHRVKFLVSAQTGDQYVYWDSKVDSGYSVDNLPPGSVAAVAASVQAGPVVNVHWKMDSADPDVKTYEVHRSVTSGFAPTAGTKIGQTADTLLVDGAPVAGSVNYYKIITVDLHDNRSAPSAEAPAVVGSTQLYSVQDKWNMVSVPLTLSDYTKTLVFPTAISSAFAYSDGYVTSPTLANGPGYWVKFSGAQSVAMSGIGRTTETIPVAVGWNMIGSIGSPVDVTTITSSPPGLVTSNFFGYGTGYQSSPTIEPGKAYWVKVNGAGSLNLSSASATAVASATQEGSNRIRIEDTGEMPPPPPEDVIAGVLPTDYTLEQNYPNPFNPTTKIEYAIPAGGQVRISVFNALGEEVVRLVDEEEAAGYHSVSFDASGLPSGMYTYRISAGHYSAVRKMMLLK